ncbi:MAG: response regulator [Atopobiaceae bacterium]|nr:response regulator [Atopobiaceae bacterium]
MTYSIIGILASIVLVIINKDVLWSDDRERLTSTQQSYRNFIIGVLGYYITDIIWGVLEAQHLTPLLYADTVVHFVAMALAVMLWTRYVVAYLEDRSAYGAMLYRAGTLFLGFEVAVVAINFVQPILFWFDKVGAYHAGFARYITLAFQILMFFFSTVYTLRVTAKSEGTIRRRNLTIGLFSLAMILLIGIQMVYPLLPLYAMGYMLGTCLLHSFVVEDEKNEYRKELENLLTREQQQRRELSESREALKDALAAAEDASKAKTKFLSNMSHEIRTPMNAIIGLDNIALADPDLSDETRRNLEMIGTSAHHLLGIINDILDMGRIESGRMIIKSEEFSFINMLAQVNDIISGQCDDKGLHYECHVLTFVNDYYVGDDQKLRQILVNVLGNAVKFTPTGGSVTMSIERLAHYEGKSTIRFSIADTGIGMSEDYLPKLFDAFSQEDSSASGSYGSTGLGMPITKSIVELMGGTIEVESEKGVGTTFTITVTLVDSTRTAATHEEELDLRSLSVLAIDDDEIDCEHAQVVLSQLGVACDTALSGAEGIEMAQMRKARREPYDLILVDWRMPGMDGVDTTRCLRETVDSDAPIIILTSYSWEDIVDEARAAGVDTFVSKPLFADRVLDEFMEAFDRKNAHQENDVVELAGRRVLLAEDIEINAEIIEMVLSMREIEVEHAQNGKVAVDMFQASEVGYYDAILMDMRMPEMDGLEATRAIRALDRADARDIPIIALTANAFDEDVRRSMQAGLNAHLSKPVEPDTLFQTLEELVHN